VEYVVGEPVVAAAGRTLAELLASSLPGGDGGPAGAAVLGLEGDPAAVRITRVVHRLEDVGPGSLFCCVVGGRVDGHDLAPAAVARGAVALLCDRLLPAEVVGDAVQLRTAPADLRTTMALLAAAACGWPSSRLRVVGVTGTNGKTTVTFLCRAVLEAGGLRCGVLGTLSGGLTTPEAPELQRHLAAEVAAGRDAVAMEVSSHSLVAHRVDGTRFAVAVFTNLQHDHLDFHGTMEAYFEAKARLFEVARSEVGVVCVDDVWGRRLAAEIGIPVVTYSLGDAEGLRVRPEGATFSFEGATVRLRLPGRFNVANALAAAKVGRVLGLRASVVAAGLSAAAAPPGRLEAVDFGQAFTAWVDYAHTPDALRAVLAAARERAGDSGRVLVVFGAGGDRDRSKRPLMGAVAATADLAILTSDNPRHEDPEAIAAEVAAGAPPGSLRVELDRARAIRQAVAEARPGDVVVVAGKGHETGQVVGDEVRPFDDRAELRAALLGEGPSAATRSGHGR